MILRREPEAHARVVEFGPPLLQTALHEAVEAVPCPTADDGARQPCADRVRREAGVGSRIDVRDQRCDRNTGELGRERRRQREDVGDDHVGSQLLDERQRVARRPYDGLVGLQCTTQGGEDVVLGRRREAEALRLDLRLPPTPGLHDHLVPVPAEGPPEGDDRERVSRIPEGAEQDLHERWSSPARCTIYSSACSSATARSCSIRPSFVHAIGVTPSVPTPASA